MNRVTHRIHRCFLIEVLTCQNLSSSTIQNYSNAHIRTILFEARPEEEAEAQANHDEPKREQVECGGEATVSSRVDRERGNPSSRSLREEPTYTVAYQAAFLLLVEFLVRDEQAAGALEVFCCPACLVRWLSSRGGLSASGEAWSPA